MESTLFQLPSDQTRTLSINSFAREDAVWIFAAWAFDCNAGTMTDTAAMTNIVPSATASKISARDCPFLRCFIERFVIFAQIIEQRLRAQFIFAQFSLHTLRYG